VRVSPVRTSSSRGRGSPERPVCGRRLPAANGRFLLDRYDAVTAERWGLVNEVVPKEELMETARAWARKIGSYSPTAIRFLKHSFNADTDHLSGISHLAFDGLTHYATSEEGMEGARAFAEKRPPDFSPYR
jgi:naphthoate synthase